MDATALPPPASGGHWTGVEQLEKGCCFLDPSTSKNTFRFRAGLWDSVRPFPILSMTQSSAGHLGSFGSAKVLSPEDLLFKVQKWVCLKMLCTPKANGFADHYPYEKWLSIIGNMNPTCSDKPNNLPNITSSKEAQTSDVSLRLPRRTGLHGL